jgi:hypothetical protein
MLHDPELHECLSPDDLPHHIIFNHGVMPWTSNHSSTLTDAMPTLDAAEAYLRRKGIESTGDDVLDRMLAWHEKTHAYSESRTVEQRRHEQKTSPLAPHGGCNRPGCRTCFPYGVDVAGRRRFEAPSPAAFGSNGEIYETGVRVWYVDIDYNTDTRRINENDPGLVTRVVDDESVMVLWLNNHEVSEHHVSVITPAVQDR